MISLSSRTPSSVRPALAPLLASALLASLALFGNAQAHDFRAGDLSIDHPYATPSLPGVQTGAAYLRGIRNKGTVADRLIGASTPVAERVELHTRQTDGDVVRMREVAAIELPAGQEVQLRHGQPQHLMLVGLKQSLKVGDRFDLTLRFERAGETTVKAWVQQPRGGNDGHAHTH